MKGKRVAAVNKDCVACGCCINYCPLHAITVPFGKPRTWCVYCPMGTMTQGICQIKSRKRDKNIR